MRIYHFVPFLFILSLMVLTFGALVERAWQGSFFLWGWLTVLVLYGVAASGFTIQSMVHKFSAGKVFMPFIFFAFHIAYGWGTCKGLLALLWKSKK